MWREGIAGDGIDFFFFLFLRVLIQGQARDIREGRRKRRMGRGGGRAPSFPLCHLMRGLQHLHEEGVDGRVADQLEEEQVLEALEADGAQRR